MLLFYAVQTLARDLDIVTLSCVGTAINHSKLVCILLLVLVLVLVLVLELVLLLVPVLVLVLVLVLFCMSKTGARCDLIT